MLLQWLVWALIIICVVVLFHFLMKLSVQQSGWAALSGRYPAFEESEGESFSQVTIWIGHNYASKHLFNGRVFAKISENYLYLKTGTILPFYFKPLSIPLGDLRTVQQRFGVIKSWELRFIHNENLSAKIYGKFGERLVRKLKERQRMIGYGHTP